MKKTIHIVFTVLSFVNVCLFFSMRPTWFFINQEMDGNPIWARLIFGILLLVFSINIIMLFKIEIYKIKHLMIGISTIVFAGLNIYLIYRLGAEKNIIIRNMLEFAPSLIILFLLALLLQTKIKLNKLVKYIVVIAIGAIIFFPKLNIQPIRITSGPNFSYVNGDLIVVWTTNIKGTGFVEIGEESDFQTITSSENGIVDGNSTHFKVTITNIVDGTSVRVGSQKIVHYFENNVVYGNTAYGEIMDYKDTSNNEEVSFYVLSDVHERKDIYTKYLSGNDYDFVVFNGDFISSIDKQDIIVSQFLNPITRNRIVPFYFARGNHETRGADLRLLDKYLPLSDNKYYYTFTYGKAFFVVLDSGEDKVDSHIEYSGFADFEKYRNVETEWLKSIVESREYEEYDFVIALSHIPLMKDDEFPYKREWMRLLAEMDADIVISGHTHKSEMVENDIIPIVIGGGYAGSNSGYEGLKVSVGDKLIIDIVGEDGQAKRVFELAPDK